MVRTCDVFVATQAASDRVDELMKRFATRSGMQYTWKPGTDGSLGSLLIDKPDGSRYGLLTVSRRPLKDNNDLSVARKRLGWSPIGVLRIVETDDAAKEFHGVLRDAARWLAIMLSGAYQLDREWRDYRSLAEPRSLKPRRLAWLKLPIGVTTLILAAIVVLTVVAQTTKGTASDLIDDGRNVLIGVLIAVALQAWIDERYRQRRWKHTKEALQTRASEQLWTCFEVVFNAYYHEGRKLTAQNEPSRFDVLWQKDAQVDTKVPSDNGLGEFSLLAGQVASYAHDYERIIETGFDPSLDLEFARQLPWPKFHVLVRSLAARVSTLGSVLDSLATVSGDEQLTRLRVDVYLARDALERTAEGLPGEPSEMEKRLAELLTNVEGTMKEVHHRLRDPELANLEIEALLEQQRVARGAVPKTGQARPAADESGGDDEQRPAGHASPPGREQRELVEGAGEAWEVTSQVAAVIETLVEVYTWLRFRTSEKDIWSWAKEDLLVGQP